LVHCALDRAKRVLNNLFALFHDLGPRSHPLSHRIQYAFIFPARDPTTFLVAVA